MTLFFNILFSPNKQNVVGALLYVFLFIFIFAEHHYYRKKKKAVTKLSKTLFPIKSSSVSCAFLVFYFEVVFSVSVVDLLIQ